MGIIGKIEGVWVTHHI